MGTGPHALLFVCSPQSEWPAQFYLYLGEEMQSKNNIINITIKTNCTYNEASAQ